MKFQNGHKINKGRAPWNKGTNGLVRPNSGSFKKGQIPWIKGLTKETDKRVERISKGRLLKKERLGYVNSPETRRKMKERKEKYFENHPEEIERMRKQRLLQKMPTKMTSIEIKIKQCLDILRVPYKTHKSVMGITQPDFFIEPNICIYCDGDYWHNLPNYVKRDEKINSVLEFAGYKVIRLWEHDIKKMELNDLKEKLDGI